MCCTSSVLRSSQAKFMTCVCVCVQACVICCAVHKMSGLCFQVEANHVNIADIAFWSLGIWHCLNLHLCTSILSMVIVMVRIPSSVDLLIYSFLAMESPSSSSSADLDSTIRVSKEKNEQFGRSDEIINAPNWITKEVWEGSCEETSDQHL